MLNRWIFPLSLIFLIGCLYYFSPVTLPFIISCVFAYIFQPLVTQLEKIYFPRWLGALSITLSLVTLVSIFFVYTAPVLYEQIYVFIFKIPAYIHQIQEIIQSALSLLNDRIPPEYLSHIQSGLQTISKDLVAFLFSNTQLAFQSGLNLIHYISLVMFIPVVTFYLLKDWPKFLSTLSYYIPPQHKPIVVEQAKQIDRMLSKFARGQALVCLILATYYGISLHMIGLDSGGLIGSLAGLFAFVPYLGAMVSFLIASVLGLLQESPWLLGKNGSVVLFGWVTVIFAIGQFLEGVILSPNIVGKSIRLHPLWIMFSLFMGGYMFGFLGVFIATPTAGALGILLRYVLNRYREKMYALYQHHIQ